MTGGTQQGNVIKSNGPFACCGDRNDVVRLKSRFPKFAGNMIMCSGANIALKTIGASRIKEPLSESWVTLPGNVLSGDKPALVELYVLCNHCPV